MNVLYRRSTAVAAVLFVIGALLMILESETVAGMFIGGGLTVLTNAYLIKHRRRPRTRTGIRVPENKLPAAVEALVADSAAAVHATALSSEHKKKEWMQTENTVNGILEKFLALIAAKAPYHTIAVFFPTHAGTYVLRRHLSKSGRVDRGAQIIPRRGILGSLIDSFDKPRQFYEPNFSNSSATLYYYEEDIGPEEAIRSITVSPIEAEGEMRGILLADSTEANAFSDDVRAFLRSAAGLLGQTIYYAYHNTELSLEYKRIVAMRSTEEEFWKNLEFDAVMDKMRDIIHYAIPCERLTISLKEEEKPNPVIMRAHGLDADLLLKMEFQIGDKNPRAIASMAFSKDFPFTRNFHDDRYECRFREDEPQSVGLASFMAVPFGMGGSKGLILIESAQKDAFSASNLDLISGLGTSAGLALEKIFILRKSETLATHDGMTGLYNNRQFLKILSQKLSAYSRYQKPISLALCDIDFFKKLNDTYGHQFGDEVLKGVAKKLENGIRIDSDAAARYGGEEFVLILDQTDAESARETVERIRQAICEMTFKTTNGAEVKTSMSFGIATYPAQARDMDDLIKKADKALYSAKKHGRNRVEVF